MRAPAPAFPEMTLFLGVAAGVEHEAFAVAQRGIPGGVGADVVVPDLRVAARDVDAGPGVAGDDVRRRLEALLAPMKRLTNPVTVEVMPSPSDPWASQPLPTAASPAALVPM
jgi:hypothetical protein